MKRFLVPVFWLVACLVVLSLASRAHAAPTAQFWEELGGSASGDGLSESVPGVPTGNRHVSVAIGPDGRPVVAYADGDTIRVRRWSGTAWELIGPSGASGGLPQIVIDPSGRMYLAWRQFAGATLSWEVFLLARDYDGVEWEALGSSGSGGGVSGAEGAAGVPAFSLALAADGTPYLAYQTTTLARTDFTAQASGLDQGTQQIFVRAWAGPTQGWLFVGSGREGGGASQALSFRVDGPPGTTHFASHGAEHPTLAIDADGHPVVAFIYTNWFNGGNPPEFNGENDDMYATRWTGTAWVPLGPALPAAPTGAGLGAPGGISNTPGWTREVVHDRLVRPSLMVDADGAPILAWGETTESDGFRRLYVHRWDGTAWSGLGSPTGLMDMIAYAYDTSLAQGADGPIFAWPRGGGTESWVSVLAYNRPEGRWQEVGAGSVSTTGISGPGDEAFNPRVAVSAAGVPTVAWIDTTPPVPQAYLRTFQERILPDLTVSSVTAPAAAQPEQSFTTTAVVRNSGSAPAGASLLRFYRATGTEHGAGDVLLGSQPVPDLAAGASATLTLSTALPASTLPGTYRILAFVDEPDAVAELSEANNARGSSALTVAPPPAPDLDITALSAPASVQAGGPLAVQHTVQNVGTAASSGFMLRFFLSTDEAVGNDVLLGTRTLDSLAAGAASTGTTTLTVPATTPTPVVYHVIALAVLDAGADRDASNNGAVSEPISVTPPDVLEGPNLPDLAATDVTVPALAHPGRPLAVRTTVRNGGVTPARAFIVRLYLSADAALDAGDVLLGARRVGSLRVGASHSAVTKVTIPAGTPVGSSYRVIAVADALDQIVEADETNNTLASASAVAVVPYRPDLTLTALTVPATGATGRPLAITSTVRNVGVAPASAFMVRLYLSADETLDAGDLLLGARTIGRLGAGVSVTVVTRVMVPGATAAPASYRVIGVVDAQNQQVELDESNNTLASATAVAMALYRPDLTPTALTMPAAGAAGRPLAVRYTLRNTGVARAGAFTVRFFLSADDALDAGDVLLGARTIGSLAAGATHTGVTTVTIPGDTPVPASYRVIAMVDALDQQAELDESNNVMMASSVMTITAYRPDLVLVSVRAPGGAAAGRGLSIAHTTRNAGTAPTIGAFTTRFYLSADPTLAAGAALIGERTISGRLAAGANRTDVTVVTVPAATVVPTTYHVIGVIDALGRQPELDESNNVTASGP